MGPPLLPDPESRHIAPVTAHDAVHSTAAHTELTNTNAPTQHTTSSNSDDRNDVGNVLPEDATPHIVLPPLVNDTMESSNGPMANGLRYRAHGSAPPEATITGSHYPIPFATSMGRGVGDAMSIMHAEEATAAEEEGPYVRDNSLSLGVSPTPQAVGRDSFGNVHYERLIGNQNNSATSGGSHLGRWLQPGSSVSWSAAMAAVTAERWNVHKNHSNSNKSVRRYFKFLFAPLFWFLLQYAARVTFIAMLVPAAIIHANVTPRPFISDTFVLSGVIVGAGVHFGQSASFCVQFIKAGFIWLPIVLICIAIRLDRHHVAWFVVYTVVLFLMATFTDRTTRRMCLMLFNITLVALLSGNTSLLYPVRVLADWAIGAGFALVATLLPYPLLATRLSESVTRKMCTTTATCFQGILLCLWAPSNTERTMSMVRMRSYIWQLDQLVDRFDAYDVYTFYEVLLFDTSERREVRKEKVKLLLNLKMNLRSMVRVINILQERPQMLDQSDRCLLCRNHLSEPLDKVTQSIRDLCDALGKAKTYADLHRALPCFEATGHAVKVLQDEFNMAQRVLFYESCDAPVTTTTSGGAAFMPPDRMEEFIPLLTFLVFSVVNFWTSLREFQHFIVNHDSRHSARNTMLLIWRAMIEPFVDNARLVQLLCTRRGKPEMRVVIEAAKVSLAMFVSVLFFYFVNDRALLLSGPTTIAFISGTNPVEAVQASAARLSGTLVGSVLGYFAASLCNSGVDRVLAICIITFFLTLPRPAHSFGVVCSYCNFIIISNLGRTRQTSVDALSRIQQNTFAVLIYCFISITVYPLSPSRVLTQKRTAVLQGVNFAVRRLVSLMYEAADGYVALPPRNADETENHNNNTTTISNGGVHVVPNSAACGSSLSSQDTAQAKPAAGLLLLPKQPITSTCTNTPVTLTTNTNTTPCSQTVLPPAAAVVVTMNGVPTKAATLSSQQQQSRTTQHHRRRPRTRLIPVHTSRPPRAQTDAEEEMQMAFQGLTGGADEPLYRFPGIRTGLAHATTLTTMRPCAQNSLLVRRNVTSSAMATRRNTNDTTNTTSGDINRSIHSTLTINNNSSAISNHGRNDRVGQNASSSHLPNSAPMSARNSTLIPFTFTVPEEEDRAIEEIMTVLASMLNWMKETTHVMPLASDELHIIPRTYPTRSCMDVHAALYRLCALVYTMACSWKQMRSKGYFTEEVGHILANLAPIAGDITACLDHFMQLFVVYVRDPSAELGNELTWRVMQLRALCAELSLRKERDILATIRQTVREQGFYGKGGNSRNSAHNSPLRYNNTTTTTTTAIPRPTVVEQPALSSSSVQWSARGVTQAASSAGGRGRGDMNASSGSEPGSFLSLVPFTTSATMGPAAPHDLSTTRPGMQVDGSRSDSRAQPMRRSTQMPHSTNNEEAGGSNVRVEVGHSDPLTRQPSDVRTIYYNNNTNTARDEGMDEPNTTQRSQSRLVSNGTRIFSDRTGLANTANALVSTEPIADIVNTDTNAMQPVAQTVFSTPHYVPLTEQSRSPSALTRHSAAAPPPAELEFDASVLTHAEQLRAELRRHRRHRTQSMMSGLTTNTTTTTTLRNAGLGGLHSSTASVVTTSTPQNEYGGPGRSPFAPPSLSPQGSLSPETPALTYSQTSSTLCNLGANGANAAPGATLANNNNNNTNTTGQPVLDSAGEAHVDPLRAPGTNSSAATAAAPPAPFAVNDEVEDNYGNRSLIRFADSFTIPVTVLDTEGLHAFTLSLEMLGKELRRVLYGMEEMLQSKLMEL